MRDSVTRNEWRWAVSRSWSRRLDSSLLENLVGYPGRLHHACFPSGVFRSFFFNANILFSSTGALAPCEAAAAGSDWHDHLVLLTGISRCSQVFSLLSFASPPPACPWPMSPEPRSPSSLCGYVVV